MNRDELHGFIERQLVLAWHSDVLLPVGTSNAVARRVADVLDFNYKVKKRRFLTEKRRIRAIRKYARGVFSTEKVGR